ncbi:MAG: MiaB/RimO family radical SAM methylthiotransferase [Kiritimatiellae bacterium]|nr:MiaB/RimO family radical SAM methylthiotransferase [Kiritimatiellia bacterium]
MQVTFKTFGCRLNQAETAHYVALFQANNIEVVPFGGQCDICVIHSCSVTQRAESESLRVVRSVKRKNPAACVVLAGCAVESATGEQLKHLGIDLIIPREQKERLVEIILSYLKIARGTSGAAPAPYFTTHRALLKIQDGCDFFCAYCIIPYNRGAPVSRGFNECLDEARAFIDQGFQELVITGCNIACYKDGGRNLPDLLQSIAALPGLGRVRLGSLEPATVELEVARVIAGTPKVCRFLHLPLQSCDDTTLQRMRRRYSTAQIGGVLDEILELVPDIALGSDLITGFPGEDEQAFSNTKRFIKNYAFSNLHVFPYSERRGTAAAEFSGQVDHSLRKERAQELIAIGRAQRNRYASSWLGREVEVLVEKFDSDGNACGWSGEYLPCCISGLKENQRAALPGKTLCFTVACVAEDVLKNKVRFSIPIPIATPSYGLTTTFK